MSSLEIADVRVFAPANDMEVSKAFYIALGWELRFDGGNLVLLENADHRFYLSSQFPESYAKKFRFHVTVENAQAWFDHVCAVVEKDERFSDVRVKPPEQQDYGALVTYVHDPSGVLLDFAQWTNERPAVWARERIRSRRTAPQ